jgi:uncharacterized protein YuzE
MKTEYDERADAAYFQFSSAASAKQVRLDDSRVIDYAEDGTLVGVEILSPSHGVDLAGLPRADEIGSALEQIGLSERSREGSTPPGR